MAKLCTLGQGFISGNLDTFVPGIYWINGYNQNSGTLPWASGHYLLIGQGEGKLCENQVAISMVSGDIKVRRRDNTSAAWSAWA